MPLTDRQTLDPRRGPEGRYDAPPTGRWRRAPGRITWSAPSCSDPTRGRGAVRGAGRPIACVAHMTDLHVGDVQSPARFEFLNREYGDPRFAELVPVAAPPGGAHAARPRRAHPHPERRAGRARSPAPPLELVLTGGDAIDNGQHNEVRTLAPPARRRAGRAQLGRPAATRGCSPPAWPDDIFWVPGRPAAPGPDLFAARARIPPSSRGCSNAPSGPSRRPGLRLPWLGCHGNHDSLCQGVGVMTPELLAALVAGRKPVALPEGFERGAAHDTFVTHAGGVPRGSVVDVTPDVERRHCTLGEFVAAHDEVGGTGAATASTSGTGGADRLLRPRHRRPSASSCWTPPARPGRPTSAWTTPSSSGSRSG